MDPVTPVTPHAWPGGGPRVLFVAEAVTLAHAARSFVLAREIERLGFTPILAVDPRFSALFPQRITQKENIQSIPTERFLAALAHGSRIYDRATLRTYVDEELALLRKTNPAVVVGDFRLTLSISARLLSIPYINITNAYWSPYARPDWQVPALPWVKYLGASTANRVFRSIRKIAFAAHARPMTMLRAEHGLLSQGNDLLRQYSDGDICMYADVPELVPTFDAPPTHRYLGPVAWSPPTPLPGWWNDLEPQEKLIYVTLGSSGDRSRLPVIVEALAGLGLSLAVATAGAGCEALIRPGVRAASFLPGDLIADRCALVVCNGGSLASYQALQKGVPILALPSNLDQFLNSGYLKARNVGDLLRPEETTIPVIRTKASALLNDSAMLQAVRQMRSCIDRYDPVTLLTSAITELCTSGPRVA